jgi:hypothetical protein
MLRFKLFINTFNTRPEYTVIIMKFYGHYFSRIQWTADNKKYDNEPSFN